MEQVDLIVIGTGGGLKIALPCAQRGMRVALIEEDDFGGTCLNRGCIPSKMLIHPGELADLVRHASPMGLHADNVQLDFPRIIERIKQEVGQIRDANREQTATTSGITLINGHGRFIAPHTVQVNDRIVSAPLIFVATGSRPRIPDIEGLDQVPYLTSREALALPHLPRSLCVIGASYIATELGYAYQAAGCDVSFVVRSRFLRGLDTDLVETFEQAFSQHHTIYKGSEPTRVRMDGDMIEILCGPAHAPTRTIRAEQLLIATGVTPQTDDLGLEHTSVVCDSEGYIQTDAFLETAEPGIFALGDCIGNYLFRHTVNYEGEYLMRHIFDSDPRPLDYGPVPYAVFTHPQLAGVGASEEQLRADGIDYICGKAHYKDTSPGMARCSTHGFVKVLVDNSSHHILGAHAVGEEAATMIHLFIAAMKLHARLEDLLDMIFIHPALPEVARDACRHAREKLAHQA
jgi:mycothione reductase